MPAMATTAINAASIAYSSRSWPSVPRASRPIATIARFIASTFRDGEQSTCPAPRGPKMRSSYPPRRVLRARHHELAGDLAEDNVHVRARERDGADADERDEGHEERVLEKILTFLAANDRLQTGDERQSHVCVLRCASP